MGCCSSRQVQEDVDMTHTAQASGQVYDGKRWRYGGLFFGIESQPGSAVA